VKDFVIKTGKRILVLLLVVDVFFISIGGYQYLFVAVAPKYNPETMILNFEIVGSGDKNFVFIHGDQDTTAPINNAMNLANTISNSEFLTVNGGDHQLFLKDPNIVWKAVTDFFG